MKARTDTSHRRRRDQVLCSLGLALMRRRYARRPREGLPPLFIIGSGRSGNTLVRRVLGASGAIYVPPETFVLGNIIEGWPRALLLTWRERVLLFCAYFEKHVFFPTFRLENLNDFAAAAAALPPDKRSLRDLIEAFYRHLAAAHGSDAPRWGDKTPYNTFHLGALDAVFPDAQYLWLVRDGRDVALSYVEAGLFDALGPAAERWVAANRACEALAARRPGAVYRQSYEALVASPAESFQVICDWAGLPFSPLMLTARTQPMGDVEALAHHRNVAQPISAASVGLWRTRLSASEAAGLSSAFWETMAKLGYGTARTDP